MRHFAFLPADLRRDLFEVEPGELSLDAPARLLGVAAGATLYMPGSRPQLASDVGRRAADGALSVVLCLEDSVADAELAAAERNVVAAVRVLAERDGRGSPPLLFVRVRSAAQLDDLAARLGPALGRLTGFVVPKFTATSGPAFLAALDRAEQRAGRRLSVMPVLESPEIVFDETRRSALHEIATLLEPRRDRVAAVRVGAADLGGLFGLRRVRGVSVYDVGVLRTVLADIVNILGRSDGTGYVLAGAVWEHFAAPERLFRPQLRRTPFADSDSEDLRARLLDDDQDELLREVVLDKANGFTGKTVIHPSHVAPVHALLVVSHEEYADACAIAAAVGGGASGSSYGNKMNEAGPHRAWALRLRERAELFGVAREGVGVVDLLAALRR